MQNHLHKADSLYLKQHADNPVNWYPWCNEAFEKAQEQNKPIIVSIGYAACHWCHVMAHQVFEDPKAAQLLNQHFIAIKVDREEKPEIDQIYMDAVQMITGSGGWPLNVFLLPNGKPFYGGTYFPKAEWMSLIERLAMTFKQQPDLVRKTADEIQGKLNRNEQILQKGQMASSDYEQITSQLLKQWKANYDTENGGGKGAPKFPMPVKLNGLLSITLSQHNQAVMDQIGYTLISMASGGIYDHVGGGFARYSVDKSWDVPHFEKMLYDNAQLLPLYAKVGYITNHPFLQNVVDETFDFLTHEMKRTDGLFATAIDADSEGEEGKFYTWKYDEFTEIVQDSKWIDHFHVQPEGNWEKTNVLRIDPEKITALDSHTIKNQIDALKPLKKQLFDQRARRVRPVRDDKAIAAWNALLAGALLDTYKITRSAAHFDQAKGIAVFIAKIWREKSYIPRILNYHAGHGMLDDYAFSANAFYKMYVHTHNREWLTLSDEIFQQALELFKSAEQDLLNYYPLNQQLFTKKTDWIDTVMPSSNAMMAQVGFSLGYVLENGEYLALVQQMLKRMGSLMVQHPLMLGSWIDVYHQTKEKPFVSIGKQVDKEALLNECLKFNLWPDVLPLTNGKKDSIIVCKGNTCFEPVKDIEQAVALLRK
jgi:uncharacterized protein YyaL (SSP411 family)